MSKTIFAIVLNVLIVPVSFASFESLEVGLVENSESWFDTVSFLYEKNYYPISVLNPDSSDILYTFRSGLSVYSLPEQEKRFGKNLSSWPSHLFLAGEYSSGARRIAGAHGETFEAYDTSVVKVLDRSASYSYDRTKKERNQVGCFQNRPLRCGDFDINGVDEVVLMLGQNIVVFSPEQEQIIFSAHYWMADEIPVEEEERYFPWEKKPEDPQYIAYSGTGVALNEMFPARRSLSKLFIGSFEDERKQDIIIWRKLYESKLRSEPEQGFDLFGETWVHYRMVNGVYQLQETAPEVLENWLASNELTWMDGVPSVSECEGQEDQLIPELHDPILNDPEILN